MHYPGMVASSYSLRPQDAAIGDYDFQACLSSMVKLCQKTKQANKTPKQNKANTPNKTNKPTKLNKLNKTKIKDNEMSQWAKLCLPSSLCLGPMGCERRELTLVHALVCVCVRVCTNAHTTEYTHSQKSKSKKINA